MADDGASLLEVLRDRLGARSAKDGCSPQGQCGCCTVLVDGRPTGGLRDPGPPGGRPTSDTLDGPRPGDDRDGWAEAFCATGASQCGFCTPGIVLRLEGARRKGVDLGDEADGGQGAGGPSLPLHRLAHHPRGRPYRRRPPHPSGTSPPPARRAELEGGGAQRVGADVALGAGGFADDRAPAGALVAVPDGNGGYAVAATLTEARRAAGKVQGRRTTVEPEPPLALPDGDWDLTLRTTWVEPAYLETDASWCEPGGEPATPAGQRRGVRGQGDLARGGRRPPSGRRAREGGPGPVGAGGHGRGWARSARPSPPACGGTAPAWSGWCGRRASPKPSPPRGSRSRRSTWPVRRPRRRSAARAGPRPPSCRPAPGARWAGSRRPAAARATAAMVDGRVHVRVDAGETLDEVVLRSYAIGAAHMALSWICSEGLAVDAEGEVHDLTIRSFGILRAARDARGRRGRSSRRRRAGQRLRRRVRRRCRGGLARPGLPPGAGPPATATVEGYRRRHGEARGCVPADRASRGVAGRLRPGRHAGRELVTGGFQGQLIQALDNLEALLAGEGATLAQVVKTTVLPPAHGRLRGPQRGVGRPASATSRPARAAFAVSELPLARPGRGRGLGLHRA